MGYADLQFLEFATSFDELLPKIEALSDDIAGLVYFNDRLMDEITDLLEQDIDRIVPQDFYDRQVEWLKLQTPYDETLDCVINSDRFIGDMEDLINYVNQHLEEVHQQ